MDLVLVSCCQIQSAPRLCKFYYSFPQVSHKVFMSEFEEVTCTMDWGCRFKGSPLTYNLFLLTNSVIFSASFLWTSLPVDSEAGKELTEDILFISTKVS